LDGLSEEHQTLFHASVQGINQYIKEAQADPKTKKPLEFRFLQVPLHPYTDTDMLSIAVFLQRFFGGSGGQELLNQEMLDDLQKQHGEASGWTIFQDVLTLNDPDAYTNVPTEIAARQQPDAPIVQKAPSERIHPMVTFAYDWNIAQSLHCQWVSRGASRSLVIGADRSATGSPLMMQATADGYDVHVHGGGFEAAGLAMAGSLPVMGRGRNYGWLITTGENDVIDIFAEELNPDNPTQYRFNDTWHDMQERQETIVVKGQDPVTITVQRTIHGPVIARDDDNHRAYSKQHAMWMREAENRTVGVDLCRATSAEDFASVVARMSQNVNVTYADTNGRIEQWHAGLVPVRADGVDPRLPTPGTGQHEWTGFVPVPERPHVADPQQGFLFAWNSKPSQDTTYGDSARWGKHFRTWLPVQLANADSQVTIEEFKSFNRTIAAGWASVDLAVTSPQFFEPYLRTAVQGAENNVAQRVLDQLFDWDGQYVDVDEDEFYDHSGLTIFREWLQVASELILQDDMGDWWHRFDEDVYIKYRTSVLLRTIEGADAGAPMQYDFFNGRDRDAVLLDTIRTTWQRLQKRFDTDDIKEWRQPIFWRYFGDVPEDELANLGYDPEFIDYISGAAVQLGAIPLKIPHNGMPEWTCVMDMRSDQPHLQTLIPTGGQSWFVSMQMKPSPHIDDQIERHRTFDYKTIAMTRQVDLLGVTSTTTLQVP